MKNKAALLFFFLAIVNTFSQAPVTVESVRVFKPEANKHIKNDKNYWAIKSDLISMAVGEFPIIFERSIANKWSVEGSAGFTYAFLSNDGLINTNSSNKNGAYKNDQKPQTAYAFRASLKYFPSKDDHQLEGISVGFQAFIKNTTREYTNVELAGEKDVKIKTGVSIQITSQYYYGSTTVVEWLFAIGYANIKREYSEYDDSNYRFVPKSTNEGSPNIQLGLRLGFGN